MKIIKRRSMVFVLITTIYAISSFSCDTFNPNKGTNEISTNDEAFFPIGEGYIWEYETKEYKKDLLISSKIDSLIIGNEFHFQGKKGWFISNKSSNYLGLNNNLIISSEDSDTVFSKIKLRSGAEVLITEFIFSPTDTVKFEYSQGDYGLKRITYFDDNRYAYEGEPYRIETEYTDGLDEMVFISRTGIVFFKRTWEDGQGNKNIIVSELINFKFDQK